MPLPVFDLALSAPGGAPVADCDCDVPIQLHSEWCWAAVTEGLANLLGSGPALTQCQVAAAEIPAPCCTPAVGGGVCNKPWDLRYPLHRANLLADGVTQGPLNRDEIVQELLAGTPPAARTANGASGHYMVVVGLYDGPGPGEVTLRLSDPAYGEVFTRLSDFSKRWTHTYRTRQA